MKNSNLEIKEYTFINSWEIEYRVGKKYFIAAIDKEDLENIFEEKVTQTPEDFLETEEQIEKVLTWFHTEFADYVEPIERESSQLYQAKVERRNKEKQVIFKPNLQRIGDTPATLEMVNPAYIQAIVERMERMERDIQKLKAEKKSKDDILLTTKQIEHHYQVSAKTIDQARVHNRIVGQKINGKEWGYEKKEVDRYIEKSKNFFKNVS